MNETVLLRRPSIDGPIELVVKDLETTRVFEITYVTLLCLVADGAGFLASYPKLFK